MIKVSKVSKFFDSNQVLEDITLEFPKGKLTTLLGKNGSGKSTLLKLISGTALPSKGNIQYKSTEVSSFNFPYTKELAFIHEGIDLHLPYTFDEYVKRSKSITPNWNQELFDKIITDQKLNTKQGFSDYSRGQKMQLLLAKAIASSIPVLLIDEITSVMDVYARKYFLDLLDQYVKDGNTVIITTNIINELEFYTNHLIILKDSKIVLNEDVKSITTNFIKLRKRDGTTHEVFDHPNCVWSGVNSDRSVSYIIPNLEFETIMTNNEIPEEIIDKRQSTLEDIFIYYFGKNEETDANDSKTAAYTIFKRVV